MKTLHSTTDPMAPPTASAQTGTRSTVGFPSPADDYSESPLNLNSLLIKHPAATFFIRASGNQLRSAGIADHDLLIVDRAREVTPNSIVVTTIHGELRLQRFKALAPSSHPGATDDPDSTEIWGVVTCVIHEFHD